MVEAIRKNEPLNDGWHAAASSFTAVLGRMATYSGQEVQWDDAVQNGPNEMPASLRLGRQSARHARQGRQLSDGRAGTI